MEVEVVIASRSDAEDIRALNREFNGVDTPTEWIEQRVAEPGSSEVVVVARVAGEAVGFGCLRIFSSVCYARPVGEISEVFVSPGHRRKGIGKQIVTRLIEEGRSREISELTVTANAKNASGRRFYESMAFSKVDHVIYKTD